MQFYEASIATHPEIPAEISNGKFDSLHKWLPENIYQHGPKYSLHELVERITGGPLQVEPYIRYLKQKFGELYSLTRTSRNQKGKESKRKPQKVYSRPMEREGRS